MPYASDAQRRYFNANKKEIGEDVVDEYNKESKGINLPEKVEKKKEKKEEEKACKKSTLKMPILKSEGMAGMTTTSGGQGVITEGMGSYPKTRKKKKCKKCKSMPIKRTETN